MGVQHAVAMFGATVLMPLLMGLDPNLSILMSGVGTLLFFVVTGGRVPSYLGSSAAFVGVVIAVPALTARAEPSSERRPWRDHRLRAGLHPDWSGGDEDRHPLDRAPDAAGGDRRGGDGYRPEPAPIAVRSVSASAFDSWMAVLTVLCIGIVAVFTRGMLQRLLIGRPDRRLRAVRPAG